MIIERDGFSDRYHREYIKAINLRFLIDDNASNCRRLDVFIYVKINSESYEFEVIISDELNDDPNLYCLNRFESGSIGQRLRTDRYMRSYTTKAWEFLKNKINQPMPKDIIYCEP